MEPTRQVPSPDHGHWAPGHTHALPRRSLMIALIITLTSIALICWRVPATARDKTEDAKQAPAHETPMAKAERAFNGGRYDDVLALAKAQRPAPRGRGPDPAPSSANLLALAARSENTRAYLGNQPKDAERRVKAARRLARRALDLDPAHVEANLQLAISDAVRGGQVGPVRALFGGYASRARRHLDRALEIAPDNIWALSTSGTWHLEVARAGGGAVYGADRTLGHDQMIRARILAPENVTIAYETALRLLASNNPEWREAALQALTVATQTGTPAAAHEFRLRTRAIALAEAVETGPGAVRDFVKIYG
ncbi:MAG: hypothetical protein AAFY83_06325 [Pseudomonadota bacterium]